MTLAEITEGIHDLSKCSTDSRNPLYVRWANMLKRCHNPSDTSYYIYGAKGTIVCDEWRVGDYNNMGYENFYQWSINNNFAKHLQLDRIDNDGNYEPDNCRYTTPKINTRNTERNIKITHKGITYSSLIDACEDLGLNYHIVQTRLKRGKMTIDRALSNINYSKERQKEVRCIDLDIASVNATVLSKELRDMGYKATGGTYFRRM